MLSLPTSRSRCLTPPLPGEKCASNRAVKRRFPFQLPAKDKRDALCKIIRLCEDSPVLLDPFKIERAKDDIRSDLDALYGEETLVEAETPK